MNSVPATPETTGYSGMASSLKAWIVKIDIPNTLASMDKILVKTVHLTYKKLLDTRGEALNDDGFAFPVIRQKQNKAVSFPVLKEVELQENVFPLKNKV